MRKEKRVEFVDSNTAALERQIHELRASIMVHGTQRDIYTAENKRLREFALLFEKQRDTYMVENERLKRRVDEVTEQARYWRGLAEAP